MTTAIKGYPYPHIWVAELSEAQFNAIVDDDVSKATETGGTISVGGQSITAVDIVDSVRTVAPSLVPEDLPRSSVASEAVRTDAGRINAEIPMNLFVSSGTTGTVMNILEADQTKYFFVRVELPGSASTLNMVSSIFIGATTNTEGGDISQDVTFKNMGHKAVKWS